MLRNFGSVASYIYDHVCDDSGVTCVISCHVISFHFIRLHLLTRTFQTTKISVLFHSL